MEAGWLAKVFEGACAEVMIINTSGGEEDRMNGSETNKRLLVRNPSYVLLAGVLGLQSVFFTSLCKTAFLTTSNGFISHHLIRVPDSQLSSFLGSKLN